jgi:hypothetical protein
MKRMLAIAALFAGNLANELAHPLQCLLTRPALVRVQRRR